MNFFKKRLQENLTRLDSKKDEKNRRGKKMKKHWTKQIKQENKKKRRQIMTFNYFKIVFIL